MGGGSPFLSFPYSVIKVGIFCFELTATEKEILRIQFIRRSAFEKFKNKYKYDERKFFDIKKQLVEYFKKSRKSFDVPINPQGTDFQRLVWQRTLEIGYGNVVTYSELANMIGKSNGARGVGNALHINPIPIIIPCHRVIKKDGDLGGYNPNIDIKKYLLDLEKE